jgi:hypothetical protein
LNPSEVLTAIAERVESVDVAGSPALVRAVSWDPDGPLAERRFYLSPLDWPVPEVMALRVADRLWRVELAVTYHATPSSVARASDDAKLIADALTTAAGAVSGIMSLVLESTRMRYERTTVISTVQILVGFATDV